LVWRHVVTAVPPEIVNTRNSESEELRETLKYQIRKCKAVIWSRIAKMWMELKNQVPWWDRHGYTADVTITWQLLNPGLLIKVSVPYSCLESQVVSCFVRKVSSQSEISSDFNQLFR
jgi:hypothetical protein